MTHFALARILPLLALSVALQLAGCKVSLVPLRPIPTGEAGPLGTAVPTDEATAVPLATSLPPAVAGSVTPAVAEPTRLATVAAVATPTATARAALPLPGTRLAAASWRTVIQAPGLPDMSAGADLGPNSRFVVATGNGALNSLRAELSQPANAWVTGLPTGTLLVGAYLGLRRGDGHDLEIVDLAVEDDTVHVAVRVVAPGEWLGSQTVFPLHLVALDRAALPAGPLVFHFVDADALAGDAPAAFDVTLAALDPDQDQLDHQEALILQAASEETAAATPSP